jgi:hypothetical protein
VLVVALLDTRMKDGSRKFGEMPQRALSEEMRDHALRLRGATLTRFVCDGVTEAWIDFTFGGHAFSINDQLGDYWFFVAAPACPEVLLREVLDHFEQSAR